MGMGWVEQACRAAAMFTPQSGTHVEELAGEHPTCSSEGTGFPAMSVQEKLYVGDSTRAVHTSTSEAAMGRSLVGNMASRTPTGASVASCMPSKRH